MCGIGCPIESLAIWEDESVVRPPPSPPCHPPKALNLPTPEPPLGGMGPVTALIMRRGPSEAPRIAKLLNRKQGIL